VAFDISTLIKHHPIGETETTLGKLYIYSMTVGAQKELTSALGKEIGKSESVEFMREFIKFICYPEHSVGEENLKPEKVVLNQNDAERLSEKDLENIAKEYLAANDYLYRESTTKQSPDDATGGTRLSIEKGDIKYPQKEGETNVAYLHRLCGLEEQRREEDAIRFSNKFKHFSDQLGNDIRQTLSMGETLRGTLGTVKPIAVAIPSYKSAMPDIAELARQKEERQLRPLRDLAVKMDKLIEQYSLSTEFMIQNNRVQTEIAEELKESGDKTSGFSTKNIFLTKIVIAITVVSVLIPIIVFIVSRYDSTEQTRQTNEHVTNITTAISNLSKPEKSPVNIENIRLNKILEELRLQRRQSSKRIEALEKQVRELEKQKSTGM
jgi:hypothetical protein